MNHNDLAHDLALWLSNRTCNNPGFFTWENMEFLYESSGVNVRKYCYPDVFAIKNILDGKILAPVTYEVKISLADFKSDINSGKWRKYQPFSAYVVFAIPEAIEEKVMLDLPKDAGLIVKHDHGWNRRRKNGSQAKPHWDRVKRGRKNEDWEFVTKHWLKLIAKERNPITFGKYK